MSYQNERMISANDLRQFIYLSTFTNIVYFYLLFINKRFTFAAGYFDKHLGAQAGSNRQNGTVIDVVH